jgi:hypothetical protein
MTQPGDVLQDKPAISGTASSDASAASTVTTRPPAPTVGTFTPPAPAAPPLARAGDGQAQIEPDDPDTWHTQPPAAEELVPTVVMWILTLLLGAVVVAAIDVVLSIWPADASVNAPVKVPILWGGVVVAITANDRMMLIATLMGVIGAMIHAMTSFADFVGNKRLVRSWLPWYFLRPVIGAGLALFFYIGFRAGLLTTATAQSDINPFGIAAIGGLAGMFSKQATDKLSEVFSTMFKTAVDQKRGGKLGPGDATKPTGSTTT